LTWEDLLASGFKGDIGIRNVRPGGCFVCPVPYWEWNAVRVILFSQGGIPAEDLRYNEAAPDEHCVFQGEVCRTYRGLELRYAIGRRKTHREAMKTASNVHGLAALEIVRAYVPDWPDVEVLLDLYDDHVVEFSTYEVPVGCIPGRHTLIWEVRLY